MSVSLHTEVARFKAWAAGYPVERRNGEWECDYGNWEQLSQAFLAHLDSCSPQNACASDISDILYAVARDNETEELGAELAERRHWFLFLLPHALLSDDDHVKWQFAAQLGNGRLLFADAEFALLKLVQDDREYVSRRALKALGQIGSSHAEGLCVRAWATGHEYQRVMALWVLNEINSPRLAEYLACAREDGRTFVVSNAVKIEQSIPP
jgi:HEAT repeat protein